MLQKEIFSIYNGIFWKSQKKKVTFLRKECLEKEEFFRRIR